MGRRIMNSISTTWNDIKTKATGESLTKYYITKNNNYIIIIGNSTRQFYTRIRGNQKIDFENNHKASAVEINSFGEGLAKVI